MHRRNFTKLITLASTGTLVVSNIQESLTSCIKHNGAFSEMAGDELIDGFINIPDSARPWTFWMWLDGNVTRKGITADLEALQKIGIRGVIIMNLGLPPNEAINPGPVRFMTPQWRELIHHAISEANRLGLQVDMNNDDGWNSGGPWITPDLTMQKLTWSETRVSGPSIFSDELPRGLIKFDTYKDISILAVPAEQHYNIPEPVKQIMQKDPVAWVQKDYGTKITAKSVHVSHTKLESGNIGPKTCQLKVSDDGISFKNVRKFETGWVSFTAPRKITIWLGEVTGRYFRLQFEDRMIDPDEISFQLDSKSLLDHWQIKAGFSYIREHGGGSPIYNLPVDLEEEYITKDFTNIEHVIDLTGKINESGRLEWDVPNGDWIIYRIGYTPTGQENGYATPEGKGLDSDKMNRKALEIHLSGMIKPILNDSKNLVGNGITMLHTDSWESGSANWTASFRDEFKQRRGYDITPWLPVMAGGRIIGSVEESERFLWDIRRTLADVFIDNHLRYFKELTNQLGLGFSSESTGRQQFLYDPITFQVCSDLPMGEFWNRPQEKRPRPDCKAAASAAHIMNCSIVGAEAFTQNRNNGGRWLESPFSLKALGDSAFCTGINRLYFHRTVAQPNPDNKPGMTWPKVGINFDTSQTWWEPGVAWIDYLSRCQYLLQRGTFVADAAILVDEGAPSSLIRVYPDYVNADAEYDTSTVTESTLRYYGRMPFLPPFGYDYDFIDAATLNKAFVKEGRLALSGSGMSYSVLVLPNSETMTLQLVKKIYELVNQGAVVVGNRPLRSPTLKDYPDGDSKINEITDILWGTGRDETNLMVKTGGGWVFKGDSVKDALKKINIVPDFEYSPVDIDAATEIKIDYIHRCLNNTDIYFISNQNEDTVKLDCWFRVEGRSPEFWCPDSGDIFSIKKFEQKNGRTRLNIQLAPSGSTFVVFPEIATKHLSKTSYEVLSETKIVQEVKGRWNIFFNPEWGGPEKYIADSLHFWADSTVEGVKYYSGTARYKKKIHISENILASNKSLVLDLGIVKEMAKVFLNGENLGVLWKPPFRIDITSAVIPGVNYLEIEVTNLWPNRLIGDAALPEEEKIANVNWNPYTPDSPLLESGLLGPVTLIETI